MEQSDNRRAMNHALPRARTLIIVNKSAKVHHFYYFCTAFKGNIAFNPNRSLERSAVVALVTPALLPVFVF